MVAVGLAPNDELSAVALCIQPIEQGCPRPSNVQVASGRGGESHTHLAPCKHKWMPTVIQLSSELAGLPAEEATGFAAGASMTAEKHRKRWLRTTIGLKHLEYDVKMPLRTSGELIIFGLLISEKWGR